MHTASSAAPQRTKDDPFSPPRRRKRPRRNPPPTPLWARRSALVGPEGLIQISESEFYEILNSGKIRAHKDGDTQQATCVFCVQDLLDYIEENSVRRGPRGTVVSASEPEDSEDAPDRPAADVGAEDDEEDGGLWR